MRTSVRIGALVASVAVFLCSHAQAGSMSATPITIDMATAPDVITLPDIVVTLGNNLTYQDDVFIRVTGANVDVTTFTPFDVASCTGYASPLGYVNNGSSFWNYRVTDVAGILNGTTCTFHGLQVSKSSIGEACTVAASYEATRFVTGQTVDSAEPVTVANITPCGPPPPSFVVITPTSIDGATDNGPQDGVFDAFLPQLSANNNGWTSLATAFEFNLAAIPADAEVQSAWLGMLIWNDEGSRSLSVSGYAGDGAIELPDFTAGSQLHQQVVPATGMSGVVADVTTAVVGWMQAHVPYAGFNVREQPANCCNFRVMFIEGRPEFPALVINYLPLRRVGIDIRPGTLPNSVNPDSKGGVPVAILSGGTLYAPTDIDVASLRFGRRGDESSLVKCNPVAKDVNIDGLMDVVCHFDTQLAGFQYGDTEGVLKGQTIAGEMIRGTDSVRIVP